MNYGEDLTYWYLRLNGFFPITNFVVHRSEEVKHTSDVDVLAIRPPYVYEKIGGRSDDWDKYLSDNVDLTKTIGIICEVKTGCFEKKRLFREDQLKYTLPRLGLVQLEKINDIAESMKKSAIAEIENNQIAKLFISKETENDSAYLNRSIQQIEDFLVNRVNRYPLEKYGDRMFFPSQLFQYLIDQVNRSIKKRKAV